MIVDTSAILAILFNEHDAPQFARLIAESPSCKISAATFAEISIVAEAQAGDSGVRQWDAFFRAAGLVIESVTEDQARAAAQAWSKFGKGRHAAALNFGDCFSYALAKISAAPLLFKGTDFRRTDITPVH